MDADKQNRRATLLMWVSHAVGGTQAGMNGTEFRAGEIARTWSGGDLRLCILYSRQGRLHPLFERLHAGGNIEYHPYEPKGRAGYLAAFWKAARAIRPDIVHMQGPVLFDFIAAWAGLVMGFRLVVTRTSNISEYNVTAARRLLFRAMDRFTCRIARGKMQISDFGRRMWAAETGARPESIAVVRNGADLVPFRGTSRACSGGRPPVFGCIAQLKWEKGFAQLFAAVERLRRGGLACRVMVLGDGPQGRDIRARAEAMGLSDSVRFQGFGDDLAAFMDQVDCLVLPSLREGVPVSLIQAAAAGRPAIATCVGGIPEIIKNGETGLLVPADSPDALADAMEILIRDPARVAAMGETARAHSRNFSLERMVSEYRRCYQAVLGAESMALPGKKPPSFRRILVLSHHGIGDTVMNLPFLHNLRRAAPGAEIHVTVKSRAERLLAERGLAGCPGMILWERRDISRLLRSGNGFGAGFSLGIEPFKAWALFKALRIGRTYGFDAYAYREKGWHRLYTSFRANPDKTHKVELSRRLFMDAFGAGFEPLPKPWFEAPPPPEALPDQYVVFHAGSGAMESHKRWPLERFVRVSAWLKQRYQLDTVLLGGSAEKDLEHQFRAAGGEAFSLIGQCDILESLGALGGARAVVGGDSGILHLAAALGKPTICVTGPTNAAITGPYGDPVRIFASSLPCAPCYGPGYITGCGKPECMKSTEWRQVSQALEVILEPFMIPQNP